MCKTPLAALLAVSLGFSSAMTTPAVAEDTTTPSNGNEQLGGSGEGTSAELSGYADESLTNRSPQQSAATSETAGSAVGSFLAALQKSNVEASKYFGNNWILYQIFIFVLHFLGGLRIPLLANFTELDSRFPAVVDDTITEAKVIEKRPTSDPHWEIWTVSSPSMGRNITVESEINFNAKRAAIGLSMGASGAVIMANQYPGHFDAVAGLSG